MTNPNNHERMPSESAISDARQIIKSLEAQSGFGSAMAGYDRLENVESLRMKLEKIASGGTRKDGTNNELLKLVKNVKDIRKSEGVGVDNSKTPNSIRNKVGSEVHLNNMKTHEMEKTALTGSRKQKSLRFEATGPRMFPTEMNDDENEEDRWTEDGGDPWSTKMVSYKSASSSSMSRKSHVTAGTTSHTGGTSSAKSRTEVLRE